MEQLDHRLDHLEINQIAIFKANRLMVQDLLVLDCEKDFVICWVGSNLFVKLKSSTSK